VKKTIYLWGLILKAGEGFFDDDYVLIIRKTIRRKFPCVPFLSSGIMFLSDVERVLQWGGFIKSWKRQKILN
jgi:hypothetical protein